MFTHKDIKTIDLLGYILKNTPFFAVCSLFNMVVLSLLPACQTITIAYFVDTATEIFYKNLGYSAIYMPIGFIILFVFLSNLLPAFMQFLNIAGKNKLNLNLRKEIVVKRSKLEYSHVENNETWELVNRICEDPVAQFLNGFSNILDLAQIVITAISLIMIISTFSWIISLIVIAISIPLYFIAVNTGRQNYEMQKNSQELQRKYKYYADILTGRDYVEERNLFGYSSKLAKEYEELYDESYKIEKKIQIRSFRNMKSGSIVCLVIVVSLVATLLFPLAAKTLTLGLFLSLTMAILNFVESMSYELTDIMLEYAQTKEYLKDFSAFLQLSERENADSLPDKSDTFVFQTMEFRNVSFCYPGTERYILKNCSFTLESNCSYAFVGENGAGKTTIIKLLTGLYEDYEGEILINNTDIKNYNYSTIKHLVSVVYQDFAKYALTVRENIFLGDVWKKDEDLMNEIIARAGMKECIDTLRDGADTQLGRIKENSAELSGGQWQSLAMARLLYAKSQINILDEPASALDPMQESQVYQSFQRFRGDKTTIYITHRMGAAKIAERILVLSEGRILEEGTHEQLMKFKNGIYKKMFEAQKAWYE